MPSASKPSKSTSLMAMIPGLGKQLKDVEFDDKALDKVESIIFSMTPDEREKPELLNMSRKKRIARAKLSWRRDH